MQVWDSGIGISEATLPRIFDEFYQVQSQRPLEAHQRKGLGLGLAIVARLAGAAGGADLRCARASATARCSRSRCRRARRCARWSRPRAKLKAPLGLTLQGRLMLVVEDEAAVREGLVVLLKAWGASVLAFDTVAAVQAWLAAQPTRSARPADRRLPAAAGHHRAGCAGRVPQPLAGAQAAGHRRHRQHHRRPRDRGRRARLPPAHQAGAAEQAARDDRLQAGHALRRRALHRRPARISAARSAAPAVAASTPGTASTLACALAGK